MLELTVTVEVAEPPEFTTTPDGLSDAVRPEGVVRVREMVPVNPLRLVRVIVDCCENPLGTSIALGLAPIVKSDTTTVKVAEWTREPLVPVNVTV